MSKFSHAEIAHIIDTCRERLTVHVDRSGGQDACWPWQKSHILGFGSDAKSKRGYGQTGGQIGPKRWHRLTHRAAMEVHLDRPLASSECVLHRCDNPSCCNPRHLFLGTRKDNADDKMTKGRHNYRAHYGSDHGMSKLTEDQVRELRDLCAAKNATQMQLAARYNVSQATVSDIIRRRIWNHI